MVQHVSSQDGEGQGLAVAALTGAASAAGNILLAAAVVDADQQRRVRLQRWADIRPAPAPAAGAGGSTDPLPMATDAVNDDMSLSMHARPTPVNPRAY